MRELSISELEKVSGGDTIVVVGSPSLESKWGPPSGSQLISGTTSAILRITT